MANVGTPTHYCGACGAQFNHEAEPLVRCSKHLSAPLHPVDGGTVFALTR